ncbi:thioesterase family protein [Gangjinia marincola]|uniref:Thioesterase family protein n=2 Tax=Gangjinia marincola TaxID=578463 RepID=A0ABN1MEW8_9FLAO
MGVVHHANYPLYFEEARLNWLDNLEISYATMEKDGIMLPVYKISVAYHAPAHFDDVLSVTTSLVGKPTAKIVFDYRILNQEEKLIATGSTTLVFVDATSRKPIACPKIILDRLGF